MDSVQHHGASLSCTPFPGASFLKCARMTPAQAPCCGALDVTSSSQQPSPRSQLQRPLTQGPPADAPQGLRWVRPVRMVRWQLWGAGLCWPHVVTLVSPRPLGPRLVS